MIVIWSGIYGGMIVVFWVGMCVDDRVYMREGVYLMVSLFWVSVLYWI